jgi:hypothetical protein
MAARTLDIGRVVLNNTQGQYELDTPLDTIWKRTELDNTTEDRLRAASAT